MSNEFNQALQRWVDYFEYTAHDPMSFLNSRIIILSNKRIVVADFNDNIFKNREVTIYQDIDALPVDSVEELRQQLIACRNEPCDCKTPECMFCSYDLCVCCLNCSKGSHKK